MVPPLQDPKLLEYGAASRPVSEAFRKNSFLQPLPMHSTVAHRYSSSFICVYALSEKEDHGSSPFFTTGERNSIYYFTFITLVTPVR